MPSPMKVPVDSAAKKRSSASVTKEKPSVVSSYSSLTRSASCWESGSSSRTIVPSSVGSVLAPQKPPEKTVIWFGTRALARTSVVPVASTSASPMNAFASLAWPMKVTAPPAASVLAPLALPDALSWWLSSASDLTSMSPPSAVTCAPSPIEASARLTLLAIVDATPICTVPPFPLVVTVSLAMPLLARKPTALVP